MQDYAFELKTNDFTFPAFALWNSGLGFYCGYLGIDETNGCYKNDHQEEMCEQEIQVHGGITFSGEFDALQQGLKLVDFSNCEAEIVQDFLIKKNKFDINDVPLVRLGMSTTAQPLPSTRWPSRSASNRMIQQIKKPKKWASSSNIDWIGFDCGHNSDKSLLNPNGKERDIDFVLYNLKLIAKIVAGSSYEISKRGKVGIPVTEEEHNKMMVLALTGDYCAEKYIQNLKVSN